MVDFLLGNICGTDPLDVVPIRHVSPRRKNITSCRPTNGKTWRVIPIICGIEEIIEAEAHVRVHTCFDTTEAFQRPHLANFLLFKLIWSRQSEILLHCSGQASCLILKGLKGWLYISFLCEGIPISYPATLIGGTFTLEEPQFQRFAEIVPATLMLLSQGLNPIENPIDCFPPSHSFRRALSTRNWVRDGIHGRKKTLKNKESLRRRRLRSRPRSFIRSIWADNSIGQRSSLEWRNIVRVMNGMQNGARTREGCLNQPSIVARPHQNELVWSA